MLVKIGTGMTEDMLKGLGDFDRDIYGKFSSTSADDGVVIGKKIVKGMRSFYAFEEN